jgi:hypothetical protein
MFTVEYKRGSRMEPKRARNLPPGYGRDALAIAMLLLLVGPRDHEPQLPCKPLRHVLPIYAIT